MIKSDHDIHRLLFICRARPRQAERFPHSFSLVRAKAQGFHKRVISHSVRIQQMVTGVHEISNGLHTSVPWRAKKLACFPPILWLRSAGQSKYAIARSRRFTCELVRVVLHCSLSIHRRYFQTSPACHHFEIQALTSRTLATSCEPTLDGPGTGQTP
jgi:hypothetical protein